MILIISNYQRGESFPFAHAFQGRVISFTKSLAVELAQFNITVSSVAPGWVDTKCVLKFSDKEYKER